MTTDFTLRPAAPLDAAVLVDLRELMLREMGVDEDAKLESLRRKSVPWLEAAVTDGRGAGWIAERDGRILGGVSMTVLQTQPQLNAQAGRIGQIYGLYVYPEHRGRGVATNLVEAAVAHACGIGCELATLHAAPRARPLYERLGFDASPEMRLFLRDPG